MASTSDPAFIACVDGEIMAWNRAATRLLGYEQRQMLGACCYRLLRGATASGRRFCDAACPVLRRALSGQPLKRFVVDLSAADGKARRVRVSAVLLPLAGSDPALLHLLEACPRGLRPGGAEKRPSTSLGPRRSPSDALTQRETEVLGLIAQGASTADIAHRLFLHVTTVRNHVQHILEKLAAHTRLTAVLAARRAGILAAASLLAIS